MENKQTLQSQYMATSSGSSVCESVDSEWPPSTAESTESTD